MHYQPFTLPPSASRPQLADQSHTALAERTTAAVASPNSRACPLASEARGEHRSSTPRTPCSLTLQCGGPRRCTLPPGRRHAPLLECRPARQAANSRSPSQEPHTPCPAAEGPACGASRPDPQAKSLCLARSSPRRQRCSCQCNSGEGPGRLPRHRRCAHSRQCAQPSGRTRRTQAREARSSKVVVRGHGQIHCCPSRALGCSPRCSAIPCPYPAAVAAEGSCRQVWWAAIAPPAGAARGPCPRR